MTQALYRKWRPRKWDEVLGQQHIVQTLQNAVASDRVMHAYLFSGPRGTGKTTVARILAKAVNCLDKKPAARPCNACAHCQAVNESRFLDLIEIDAASNTSVDDVRDLRDKINFSPNQGQYKVYIIDEVHMLSTAAFNALLKTLEEPPPHAIFVLATTEIHKIPPTVLSRCQRHEFRRLPVDDIIALLNQIVKTEKLTAEPEALALIARQATGSLRDAISLLDQLASTGQPITLGLTQTVLGIATSQTVLDLVEAVQYLKPAAGMEAIHRALDSGTDPRVLARQVVDYLRALLLVQMGNEAQVELPAETREQVKRHAKAFSSADVLRMIRAFNAAATDLRGGWQPSLSLELALAELMEAPSPVEPVKSPSKVEPPAARPVVKAPAAERPATPPGRPEASPRVPGAGPQPGGAGQEVQTRDAESAPKVLHQEATEKAAEAAPQAKSSITLDQIAKAWKQIRTVIKPQNPALDALLNSCKLLEVKDEVLVLGFASEVVRSKMDKTEYMEIAHQAIAQVLGVDVSIRCVVSNAKQSAPPDVKADGMVAAALKAGGEIVDIQE